MKNSTDRFLDKGWEKLPYDLFGVCDINDFDDVMKPYSRFLDGVKSLKDLHRGLKSLGPLAEDALEVAAAMDQRDFIDFKLNLARERYIAKAGEPSIMPRRYDSLLVPIRLFEASFVAERFEAPLGTAALRILQTKHLSS